METKLSENLMDKITRYAPALFEKAESEEKAKTLAERKTKAGELTRVEAETLEQIQSLLKEQAQAADAVQAAEKVLEEKRQVFAQARSKVWNAKQRGESQAAKLRAYLLETASPEIDEAIIFFQDRLKWLREPGRIRADSGGSEKNFIFWKKTVKAETNKNAVLAALDYCKAAIEKLKVMKLEPELDQEGIEMLKTGIPDVGEYEQFAGEKPLDRLAGPGAGMMSDSQSDWQTGKLIEKANRELTKAK